MPHIIYCWETLIKVHTHTAYTELLYMWFVVCIQYLCKHSFSIPFKEYAITLHIMHLLVMPHIISHWKALIKIILNATYTALLYPQFVACMQYLCKHSFSIPFKEYAITLHIIHIMPHTICQWKALIKIILNAVYPALVHLQFWPHLQYFCIRSFTLM